MMTISRSLCVRRTKRYLRYKMFFFGRGEDGQISVEYLECPYSHCLSLTRPYTTISVLILLHMWAPVLCCFRAESCSSGASALWGIASLTCTHSFSCFICFSDMHLFHVCECRRRHRNLLMCQQILRGLDLGRA